MRRQLYILAIAGMVTAVTFAQSQPFQITATSHAMTITGGSAIIKVVASVQSGFKASIFLSAECPSLPKASVAAQEYTARLSDLFRCSLRCILLDG